MHITHSLVYRPCLPPPDAPHTLIGWRAGNDNEQYTVGKYAAGKPFSISQPGEDAVPPDTAERWHSPPLQACPDRLTLKATPARSGCDTPVVRPLTSARKCTSAISFNLHGFPGRRKWSRHAITLETRYCLVILSCMPLDDEKGSVLHFRDKDFSEFFFRIRCLFNCSSEQYTYL